MQALPAWMERLQVVKILRLLEPKGRYQQPLEHYRRDGRL